MDDDLRAAVVVAQVEEEDAAVVALVEDPAGEAGGLARVLDAELVAGVGAVGVHGRVPCVRCDGAEGYRFRARKASPRAGDGPSPDRVPVFPAPPRRRAGYVFAARLRAGFSAEAGIASSVQVSMHLDGPRVIHEPRV